MRKYKTVISKFGGDKKVASFTLRAISIVDFTEKLRKYGWKIESLQLLQNSHPELPPSFNKEMRI